MGTDKGEGALSAAEVAGADEVVAELPHGYSTLLDRRFKDGHELSGGQWQRIAVARGFYRDAAAADLRRADRRPRRPRRARPVRAHPRTTPTAVPSC